MHNWSFRFSPKFSLEFKNLFNQLGFADTLVRSGAVVQDTRDELAYSQRFESRSIYSGQLVGRNTFTEKSELNWQIGYGSTRRTEPDWRRLRYTRPTDSGQPFSAATSGQAILTDAGRFFSELDERAITVAANFDQKLGSADSDSINAARLKVGFYTEKKNRDFAARFFGYTLGSTRTLPVGQIFVPQNVNGEGNFSFLESTQPSDRYTAANTLLAGYASVYLPIGRKFNATVGLRVENNLQELDSRAADGPIRVNNSVLSPLPSVNIAYNLNDKQLVRLAYAYTINRPEFRELAPFIYYDFNINANIIGNEFLKTSNIQNVDVRWEFYPSAGELISFGAFYKYFRNPVENYLRTSAGGISYTFVNAKEATSYGVEAEVRKSFSELSQSRFIQNLTLVANASYIISGVDLGESVRVSRVISLAPLPVAGAVDQNRPLQNQSPYLINAGLYFNDSELGLSANALYNVFGKRIFAVGSTENPTIYEMPRHVVDLNITKTIGRKFEIRANIQDLFNQRIRLEQDFNRDAKINNQDQQPIRMFRRGVYTSLGLIFNLNRSTQTPSNN